MDPGVDGQARHGQEGRVDFDSLWEESRNEAVCVPARVFFPRECLRVTVGCQRRHANVAKSRFFFGSVRAVLCALCVRCALRRHTRGETTPSQLAREERELSAERPSSPGLCLLSDDGDHPLSLAPGPSPTQQQHARTTMPRVSSISFTASTGTAPFAAPPRSTAPGTPARQRAMSKATSFADLRLAKDKLLKRFQRGGSGAGKDLDFFGCAGEIDFEEGDEAGLGESSRATVRGVRRLESLTKTITS